jgi:cytochrome c-type biogenesis protein CcmH/NrfG
MKKAALLVLTLGTFMQLAWAAEDLITSQLVEQARHWHYKDRDDLAADIWRSVLRADPGHGEALVKLGLIEARNNNRDNAQRLLEHASRVRPRPAGLATLGAALATDPAGKANAVLPTAKPGPSKPVKRSNIDMPIKKTDQKTDTPADSEALILKP